MGGKLSAPKKESVHFAGFVKTLPRLDGAVHAVTGCTSGTGFVYARTVAELGATVVMLNRASERVGTALAALQAAVPGGTFDAVECDLKSLASVRAAAKKVSEKYDRLDVLVNNAGVMALPEEDVDGFDVQIHVNHLAHFCLTSELWPLLQATADAHGQARVVNHSSGARRRPALPITAKYFTLGNSGKLGGNGNGVMLNGARWQRYQQTKLANLVFTYGLADRSTKGVLALCAHPGLSATNLQVTTSSAGGMWIAPLSRIFMSYSQSSEDGTMGILRAGAAADVANGDFYGPKGFGGEAVPLDRAREKLAKNPEGIALLWDLSERACGRFQPA